MTGILDRQLTVQVMYAIMTVHVLTRAIHGTEPYNRTAIVIEDGGLEPRAVVTPATMGAIGPVILYVPLPADAGA